MSKNNVKLVWRVSPPPTGRFRSFEQRQWPMATFHTKDGAPAASITAENGQEYEGRFSKGELGFNLVVRIRIPSRDDDERAKYGAFRWGTLKERATSVDGAKDIALRFYTVHPEYVDDEK